MQEPRCLFDGTDNIWKFITLKILYPLTVYIPKTDEHFATSLAVIPLQLMGYYVSVAKGLDVDKPRNLAKSVTVE